MSNFDKMEYQRMNDDEKLFFLTSLTEWIDKELDKIQFPNGKEEVK